MQQIIIDLFLEIKWKLSWLFMLYKMTVYIPCTARTLKGYISFLKLPTDMDIDAEDIGDKLASWQKGALIERCMMQWINHMRASPWAACPRTICRSDAKGQPQSMQGMCWWASNRSLFCSIQNPLSHWSMAALRYVDFTSVLSQMCLFWCALHVMFSTLCCCAAWAVPPLGVPVGARGTLPLNIHAPGEAHTPEVSEGAAQSNTGGARDPSYCWKHNANGAPLWPGWA